MAPRRFVFAACALCFGSTGCNCGVLRREQCLNIQSRIQPYPADEYVLQLNNLKPFACENSRLRCRQKGLHCVLIMGGLPGDVSEEPVT